MLSNTTISYPQVLNLEIEEDDLGNYDKINKLISEKVKEAGMIRRLQVIIHHKYMYPNLRLNSKYIIENNLEISDEILNKEFLDDFSEEVMGVRADFEPVDENMDNYFMLILESIYY